MRKTKRPDLLERLLELLRLLASLDLPALLARAFDLVRVLRRLLRRHACHYSYEILTLETTVELCDPRGDRAIVRRRKRIRFLQDDVVAVTERVWGTGFFSEGYRCSPGVAVDFYEEGSRWTVLISLRETRKRGDTLALETSRTMLGSFPDDRCWWEEEIYQPTAQISVTIIFPKERRCRRATLTQRSRDHAVTLPRQRLRFLSDGRQALTWQADHPQLHDLYRIAWSW